MRGTAEGHGSIQLDRAARSQVERAVLSMRATAEADLHYQLTDRYGLDDPETVPAGLSEADRKRRSTLHEAIEREAVDGHDWPEALERYVQGTGYTVVNRLAALRCMEARGFLERPVTQFRQDGRTPAADPLMDEEYLPRDEAILEAYRRACDGLAEEVELLFHRASAYSRLEPRARAFEELCRTLDQVPEAAWRADDVLGWVYQYYHIEELDELRSKAGREGLDPEDVAPANQFYTPHWVVRMLTDNSLGKLYLEHAGQLDAAVEAQEPLSPEERKHRSLAPEATPTVADLCTYLVPGSEAGESTEWSDPSELRVIDPACGSGHFLLYAFDVLERIWWAERPDVPRAEVPTRILYHNLYGVDIDLRACQLAAFNLYLKARSRVEAEGAMDFELPLLNIVCADARVAEIEEAKEVFAEVTAAGTREREALETLLETFRGSYGLGSLLDVKGTLRETLAEQEQRELLEEWAGPEELLHELVTAVEHRRSDGSSLVRDLKSFLRLLKVLAGSYDVALMNPPYGSGSRMPEIVKQYVSQHYTYPAQYYINFFEVCNNVLKTRGRIGMLIPRSFMFARSWTAFRGDFVGQKGSFDFLAEFGLGVLDNATVRTVGTVVRKQITEQPGTRSGLFIRLHDIDQYEKENVFLRILTGPQAEDSDNEVRRLYSRALEEFAAIPSVPLSYWVPYTLRKLFQAPVLLDADNAGVSRDSFGRTCEGMTSGDNGRFYRKFWEVTGLEGFVPIAKGGSQAAFVPETDHTVYWGNDGKELARFRKSYLRNADSYFSEGATWTSVKEGGQRFGFLDDSCVFDRTGRVLIAEDGIWALIAYANSSLFHYLMLAQTPERDWMIRYVAKMPWDPTLSVDSSVMEAGGRIRRALLLRRTLDIKSIWYLGPELLIGSEGDGTHVHERHPHRRRLREWQDRGSVLSLQSVTREDSLGQIAESYAEIEREIEKAVVWGYRELDRCVFDHFEIGAALREVIGQELCVRGGEEVCSGDDEFVEPEAREVLELLGGLVQRLVHHFVVLVVHEDDGGVVPLKTEEWDEERDLRTRVAGCFLDNWGEDAGERLGEADQALGDRVPTGGESYPNLRAWLSEELFGYHTSVFENTPFLWRLTTDRLVPDARGEGFGCVIDYHQLSASTFDTLHQRYLQPRRAALRERRDAADERRRDQRLPASERAEAEQEFQRCRSGIEQIEALEEKLRELARPRPRDWTEEDRALAKDLGPKVARFRERLEERLTTLDQLWETATEAWLEDTFSPTFRDRVQDNRGEWVDALEDLETACEAYARPPDEPVEAHLYDLFVYYHDKLIGSNHYGSNGIFFLNYYFSKGGKYLAGDGKLRSGLQGPERLMAELARETDADIELGREIADACKELARRIPSDWEERALAEVTTAGYRPVHKHGVRINITPLAEARLVPELVEQRVL